MDPFKILSRSSKLYRDSTSTKTSSSTDRRPHVTVHDRPPAQANSTPTSTNSKKRKRGGRAHVTNGATVDQSLDFFSSASHSAASKLPTHSRNPKDVTIENRILDESDQSSEEEAVVLDSEESKSILRKHKIRIVRLWSPQQDLPKSKQDKKSKRRSSSQEEDTSSSKKGRKPEIITQPLVTFKELRSRYKIYKKLVSNIEAQGYRDPTEVQLGSLPLLLDAQRPDATSSPVSLLSVAPTGSGKTLAFLIPTVNAILQSRRAGEPSSGPQVVILAPTKELAWQIVNEAKKLTLGTGVRVTLMKKGMKVETSTENSTPNEAPSDSASGYSSSDEDDAASQDSHEKPPQKQTSSKNSNNTSPPVKSPIIVATPLTLLNALNSSSTSTSTPSLPGITSLILDEADILLDQLFRDQTLAVVSACTNQKLQMTMWSATMGSNIESLAQSLLRDRNSPFPLLRAVVGIKDTAVSHIHHRLVYAATEHGKLTALRDLLRPSSSSKSPSQKKHTSSSLELKQEKEETETPLKPPFLIFTQTIPPAPAPPPPPSPDIPAVAGGSSRLAVLHADLSSTAREAIMRRFRAGEIWVLITTDVLARGIDFRGLNGVVNYDFPQSAAVYVHRVGRAGRVGRQGVAVTLYAKEDVPFVKAVVNVIRTSQLQQQRKNSKGTTTTVKETEIPEYLLTLPAPSKRAKKELKKRGVASRRTGAVVVGNHNNNKPAGDPKAKTGDSGKPRKLTKTRISTKSGYDRRLENRRRGFVAKNRDHSRGSAGNARGGNEDAGDRDGEFAGFD